MLTQFTNIMNAPPFEKIGGVSDLAVAVSGGPDSMALAKLLSDWSGEDGRRRIHVLTVNHGLRPEAASEAEMVASVIQDWPHVKHETLIWQGDKPETRVQEAARIERYRLMEAYCARYSIKHLFLAHHGDDQTETFLFRLSKGSGLDGLCGMRPVQERGALMLCRPLLGISKADLVQFCDEQKIRYVDDPTNDSDDFSRVRIRKMIAALEGEGLSFKRLNKTMERLDRARDTLVKMADYASLQLTSNRNSGRIVFDFSLLVRQGEEVIYRVVKMAMDDLSPPQGYGARTEKLESLIHDLMNEGSFRKRSLGGVIFERSKNGQELILYKEVG